MRGSHPFFLFHNPHPKNSQEEIFAAINSFSDEVWDEDTALHHNVSAFFPLLPTYRQNRLIKGIMFSHGADLLLTRMPWLKNYFFTFSYAMYSSFPQANLTDGLMYSYKNPAYEAWFRRQHPKRAHKILVPIDDTDFFDEMQMVPRSDDEKMIDVLVVSRLDVSKNLPMFARMLKAWRSMYPDHKLKTTLKVPAGLNVNFTGLSEQSHTEIRRLFEILGFYPDYLYLASDQINDMSHLYRRARCVVMCGLVEGKNRSIHEAMSCNVPVVTFADFNKFTRGKTSIFPKGGGLTAPAFTPESLAMTVKEVLDHPERFNPREALLKQSGRQHVLDTLMRTKQDYYVEHFGKPKGRWTAHPALDRAMMDNWDVSLLDHIFRRKAHLGPMCHLLGVEDIELALTALHDICQRKQQPVSSLLLQPNNLTPTSE